MCIVKFQSGNQIKDVRLDIEKREFNPIYIRRGTVSNSRLGHLLRQGSAQRPPQENEAARTCNLLPVIDEILAKYQKYLGAWLVLLIGWN